MSLFDRLKAAKDAFMGKAPEATQEYNVKPIPAEPPPPPPPAVAPATTTNVSIQATQKIVSTPPPRPLPAYAVKHSAFREFSDNHREHQRKAIEACENVDIGQISIPTGTGKSRIQEHLHLLDMLAKQESSECGVYVIAAHRLALCKQLLTDLIDLVAACRLPFDVIFVGSDTVDEDAIYEKHMKEDVSKKTTYVTASTKTAEITLAVLAAAKDGRHTLIVSTYHSFHKLVELPRIDLVTYDEAHTIASSKASDDNFEAHVTDVQKKGIIKRQFFFTATRKVSGEDNGMNNQDIYGPLLYEEPPINMILAGEIVPPRIHRVATRDDGEFRNDTMLVKCIQDSFSEHRNAVKNASSKSSSLGAKLLVSMEGTPELDVLRTSDEFRAWCLLNKIKLFMFSSLLGNFMFDENWEFHKVSRDRAIEGMQNMGLKEDALLIHIDILAEGIDLPAVTGVLPFRDLNLIKLLQTIGRGARLVPDDRRELYSGRVKPMEWDKMIKPYCWVIFPKLNESTSKMSLNMESTIKKVLEAYDAPKMEFSREDEYKGYPDPELSPITPRDKSATKDPVTDLIHTLEDLLISPGTNPHTPQTIAASLAAAADPSLQL